MTSVTVLVVDDDPWQCDSYRRILEQSGYTVHIVNTAEQAIEAIIEQVPNAILLDMLLAGNTAFVLLHELQSDAHLAEIPIVASTNLADQLDPRALKSYGIVRLLDKSTMHPSDVVAAMKAAGA